MAQKIIAFDGAASGRLLRGIDMLDRVVRPTLGPSGRQVLIERPFASPLSSRDGYTLSKELELADPIANMGVRALREVAWRMSDQHGDGTTTAMVLTAAMVREGTRAIAGGLDGTALQRSILCAATTAINWLRAKARPVHASVELAGIATLAAGDDAALGTAVADIFHKVGSEGFVLVEDANEVGDRVQVHEGMHWEGGWISSHFATDREGLVAELEDPLVLLHLSRITTLDAILPALNAFASSGKPLLIVAEDVGGEALAALILNKTKNDFKVAAVKAPGFGQWRKPMLEDLAIATGGEVIGDEAGNQLEQLRPQMLGRARRVRITARSTTVIEGAGATSAVAARADSLRLAVTREQHLSFDREKLQERLARLVGGVAVARFGGMTELESADRKARALAAVAATRSALRDGVLLGGGAALLHAARAIDGLASGCLEDHAGFAIVRAALRAPLAAIADNRGREGRLVANALADRADPSLGYDARTDALVPLAEAGVLDAATIVTSALRDAASTAVRLINVGAAVAEHGRCPGN